MGGDEENDADAAANIDDKDDDGGGGDDEGNNVAVSKLLGSRTEDILARRLSRLSADNDSMFGYKPGVYSSLTIAVVVALVVIFAFVGAVVEGLRRTPASAPLSLGNIINMIQV